MSAPYEENRKFINLYKNKGLNKGPVIAVLEDYVQEHDFVKILDGFLKECVERLYYGGVTFSDEFEPGEEEYFGEDLVMFYFGDFDNNEDVVNHKELCEYLQVASDYYVEKNPATKEIIEEYMLKIKEKYNI